MSNSTEMPLLSVQIENPSLCDYPVFYYICNPFTGEHIALPKARGLEMVQVSGFGFDSNTSEYKVIRFYYERNEGEVFTLGSSRWRRIEKGVPETTLQYPYGMYVSNHLHWISCGDDSPLRIVAFNMAAEDVHEIEPPTLVGQDVTHNVSLGVIEERLVLFCERKSDNVCYEIWVMKDYGMQGSWAKEYFFSPEVAKCLSDSSTHTVTKLRNGEFLVQYNWGDLGYYDHKQKTCRRIVVERISWIRSIFQVGSLFSPKNVGKLVRSG